MKNIFNIIHKNQNQKGFTVIELLVTVGIMALLTGLFLVNFREIQNRHLLENEKEELVTILKQAQIYALVGQTIGDVRYNYGVHVGCANNVCKYVLFKDNKESGDKKYQSGEEISIKKLSPKITILSGRGLNVVFEVPLGNIWFGGAESLDEATITLNNLTNNTPANITINRISGKIQ